MTIDRTWQRPKTGPGHPLGILLSLVVLIATPGCSEEITSPSPLPTPKKTLPPIVTAADHIRQGHERLKTNDFGNAEASFRAVGPAATGKERAEALVGLAEVMRKTSRAEDAMALVEQSLTIQPNFPPALRSRGYLLLAQKDYLAAKSSLEAFVAQTPGDTDARYRIALICQLPQLADFESAKVHLQAIIDKKNDDHLARYQLAYSHLMLVEIKSAAKEIEAAIKLSPGVPSYHELACEIYSDHRPKECLREITKAISLDPSRASAFFLRGMLYNSFATQLRSDTKALELLKQEAKELMAKALEIGVVTDKKTPTLDIDRISNGLVTLCLSDLGEAIRLTDKPAHYQLRRGRVLFEWGRLKEAVKSFEEAAKDRDVSIDARYELAAALSTLGKVQPALVTLTTIIDGPDRQNRAVIPLVILRSRLQSSHGQHQEAIDGLETARKRFPDDASILLELAKLVSRDSDNLNQALELANEARNKQPRNHVAQLLVVSLLVRLDKSSQALGQLQKYIQGLSRRAGPQSQDSGRVLSECQVQLGRLHFRSRRPDLALSAFSEAIRHDKENDEAFRLRAKARLFTADPDLDAAMKDLDTALQRNPENILAWFDQAELLFNLGTANYVSFAKDAYSQAIRLDPTFLEAYEGRVRCYKFLNAKRFKEQIQADETMINQLRQK